MLALDRPSKSILLPENVWVVELVHELHLLEHVVPVRAVLVHLEHHHLPGGFVGHLKESRKEAPLEKSEFAIEYMARRQIRHRQVVTDHWRDARGRTDEVKRETAKSDFLPSFRIFPSD